MELELIFIDAKPQCSRLKQMFQVGSRFESEIGKLRVPTPSVKFVEALEGLRYATWRRCFVVFKFSVLRVFFIFLHLIVAGLPMHDGLRHAANHVSEPVWRALDVLAQMCLVAVTTSFLHDATCDSVCKL